MNALYYDFYQQHKWLIGSHVCLTLLIVPLEIILFGIFSKKMLEASQSKEKEKIFYALLVFFIIIIVIQLFYLGKDMMDSRIIPEFESHVRSSLLENIISEPRNETDINMSESFFHLSRLSTTLHHNYENFLKYIIPFVVGSTVFTGYVFYISWQMGIFCFVFFLIFFISFYYWFFHLVTITNERFDKENDLMDKYEDVLLNQQNIHVAGQSTNEIHKCKQKSDEFQHYKRYEINQLNIFRITLIIVLFLFFISLFVYTYYLHKRSPEIFPIWKLLAFLTILILMSKTMISLLSNLNKIIYHYGNSSQLEKYIDKYPPLLSKNQSNQTPSDFNLSVKNIEYSYSQNEKPIFEDYSIDIPEKTSWLIRGNIGSGKSTLAQLMARLLHPSSGTITIGGVPIENFSQHQFAELVGYMNQRNLLMNGRVIDNIFYQCRQHPYPMNELFDLNLPIEFMRKLYHPVTRQGSNFSGGQRRLIFFLRSYFSPCKILIFDEPTANLDTQTRQIVLDLLQRLVNQKNRTIIVISHENLSIFQNVISFESNSVMTPPPLFE